MILHNTSRKGAKKMKKSFKIAALAMILLLALRQIIILVTYIDLPSIVLITPLRYFLITFVYNLPMAFFLMTAILSLSADISDREFKAQKIFHILSAIFLFYLAIIYLITLFNLVFLPYPEQVKDIMKKDSLRTLEIAIAIFRLLTPISLFLFCLYKAFYFKRLRKFNIILFASSAAFSSFLSIIRIFQYQNHHDNLFMSIAAEVIHGLIFLISVAGLMIISKNKPKEIAAKPQNDISGEQSAL